MHTFYQRHHFDYRWTIDHPLEQVRGNPSKQTRRQLVTDLEMRMFALIVSLAEPKNIKKVMAGHAWIEASSKSLYDELSTFLMSKGSSKGTIDYTLFTIRYGEDILLVQIYVGDIIFGFTNPKYSKKFEKLMHNRFDMSLMGKMKFFLGLQIHQTPRGIFINQSKYALDILKRHGMENCDSIGTPMATKPKLDVDLSGEPVDQTDYYSKIGSLMYLTSSRPDIVQVVCYCARYQARPTKKHLKEVKRIFRHLRGTIMGLCTSGGIQFLGDKLVSWMSKKQDYTAMSSAEAEYVALFASCAQVMWMRTQLKDYGLNYNKIPLYCDSQSAIAISCNPNTRTEYQLADMFTKALPEDRFHYLINCIGTSNDGVAASFQLKSDSLPHAHAQTTKTTIKHLDSSIKKAQVLKTKTFAYSDNKDNSSEIKL
ncbi:retrovirus-related pol polyprotein from transposon TNT 1-94 [Tanacetum coccineum]